MNTSFSHRSHRSKGLFSRLNTPAKAVISLLTGVALVAAFVGLCVVPASWGSDSPQRSGRYSAQVGQTILEKYCPGRMQLADTGSFGDNAFSVSEGDSKGQTRTAAFGSVYSSNLGALQSDQDQSVNDTDLTDTSNAVVQGQAADKQGLLSTVQMLSADEGEGSAAATASWATKGDLQGMSATSCAVPQLEQSMMTAPTTTGWTQQLILANSSDKATTVSIQAWGSKTGQPVALETDSSVSVNAHAERIVNLSAAAPDQQALYVTLISSATPVAAVTRVVHMDGLTPRGSDFAVSGSETSETVSLTGIVAGAQTDVSVFSKQSGMATVSWITRSGVKKVRSVRLTGQQVNALSLGKAPADAYGIVIDGDAKLDASARCTQSSDNQSDFLIVNSVPSFQASAITIPDGVNASVTVMNASDAGAKASFTGYDAKGNRVGTKTLDIAASRSMRMNVGDIVAGAVSLSMESENSSVTWSAQLSQQQLSKAKVIGLAHIAPSTLMPSQARVVAEQSLDVVR